MRYYIIKQGDSIDKILNKFGITYQNFISLNDSNIKELIKVGNKIKIGNIRIDSSLKENINKIYQDSKRENDDEFKYICPYCKNIIIIPKQ